MFSHVDKLRNTSIRAHRATKKKLLDAIKNDYLDHVMTTKFFIDHAVADYKNCLKTNNASWTFKRPLKVDFSSGKPSLTVGNETYSITDKDKEWIAAEALNHSLSVYLIWCFEEFEIFLKNTYALVEFMDNANWQENDFGNRTLKEIEFNKFSEYQARVRANNKLSSDEIIKRLKKLCPLIKTWEGAGVGKTKKFHWRIAYITRIRHILVHKAGTIDDINYFEQCLRGDLGLRDNKDFDSFLLAMRQMYIVNHGERQSNIVLFDVNSRTMANKCNTLIDILQLYTEFVYEAVKRKCL